MAPIHDNLTRDERHCDQVQKAPVLNFLDSDTNNDTIKLWQALKILSAR